MLALAFLVETGRSGEGPLLIDGLDITVDAVVAMDPGKIPTSHLRHRVAVRPVEIFKLGNGDLEEIFIRDCVVGARRQRCRLPAQAWSRGEQEGEQEEEQYQLQASTQERRLPG